MSIVNRRNAMLGWTVWQVGKRLAKHKAKKATPGVEPDPKKKRHRLAIVAALAAAGGLFLFWRKQGAGEEPPPPPI